MFVKTSATLRENLEIHDCRCSIKRLAADSDLSVMRPTPASSSTSVGSQSSREYHIFFVGHSLDNIKLSSDVRFQDLGEGSRPSPADSASSICSRGAAPLTSSRSLYASRTLRYTTLPLRCLHGVGVWGKPLRTRGNLIRSKAWANSISRHPALPVFLEITMAYISRGVCFPSFEPHLHSDIAWLSGETNRSVPGQHSKL